MSKPVIRRVSSDLYFVEWGNVKLGGTFRELATFAAELQDGMTKALAGNPEDSGKPLGMKQLADAWRPNHSRGEEDY